MDSDERELALEIPTGPLFTREGRYFVPTDRARGPWSPDSLHGSPVAALITFAVEQQLDPSSGLRIARQTIDLFRPVPYGLLEVEVEPVRQGRRIAVFQVRLSCEGKLLTQATTLCLLNDAELGAVGSDYGSEPPMPPQEARPNRIERSGARWTSYPGTLEMRHVTSPGGGQPPTVWIRTDAPVVADAELSPATAAASIADFVSPFANMQPGRSGYVNADITMLLHRAPVGDWHFLRVVTRGAANGIATAQAVLGDRQGAYGASAAASLINPS